MSLERQIVPGYRVIGSLRGDTLQRIAQRELGDAARWVELADLNGLVPPYLTDDPAAASDRVFLTGARILVPAAQVVATQDTTTDDLFGVDILLRNEDLAAVDGDIELASGVSNLTQALRHLLATEPGDLLFHPRYGCGVRPFLGASNSRANALVAGGLVKRAVLSDDRISTVKSATVTSDGDALRIAVVAEAVHSIPISVQVP